MRTKTKYAQAPGATLMFVVVLAAAVGLLEAASPDNSWGFESETEIKDTSDPTPDGKRTDTRSFSDTSQGCASDGQEYNSAQALQQDGDGSVHSTDTITLSKGDGTTWTRGWDEERDPAGNYKSHREESQSDKDGNRETTTTDDEFDSQGHQTKHNQKTVRDTRGPRSDYRDEYYWTGLFTQTSSRNEASTTNGDFGGLGRNQKSISTRRYTAQDVVTARLLPPSREALVVRKVQEFEAANTTKTQELRCNSKWNPWQHDVNAIISARGQNSRRRPFGVSVGENGHYKISFAVQEVTGTRTFAESSAITPGKCWGSPVVNDARTAPADWSNSSVETEGDVDPKHADTLTGNTVSQIGGMTVTKTWSLTKKQRCPKNRQQ
jgi:hypothetical protein